MNGLGTENRENERFGHRESGKRMMWQSKIVKMIDFLTEDIEN